MSELENMTLLELRNFAKEQNIRNISKLKKEELIVLLRQVAETSKPQEKPQEAEIKYDIKRGYISSYLKGRTTLPVGNKTWKYYEESIAS